MNTIQLYKNKYLEGSLTIWLFRKTTVGSSWGPIISQPSLLFPFLKKQIFQCQAWISLISRPGIQSESCWLLLLSHATMAAVDKSCLVVDIMVSKFQHWVGSLMSLTSSSFCTFWHFESYTAGRVLLVSSSLVSLCLATCLFVYLKMASF